MATKKGTPPAGPEEWQSAARVGKELGIGAITIVRMAAAGEIRCVRKPTLVTLFSVDDVREALKRRAETKETKLRSKPVGA